MRLDSKNILSFANNAKEQPLVNTFIFMDIQFYLYLHCGHIPESGEKRKDEETVELI